MSGLGTFSARRIPNEAPRPPKEPVLAVGGRAILRARDGRPSRIPLTDDVGTTVLTTLSDGVVVEITAWLPRRNAGALYRVRTTIGDEQEGWVSATNLEPRLRPAERKPVHAAGAPVRPGRAKAVRRAPAAS